MDIETNIMRTCLTGRSQDHLATLNPQCLLHKDVLAPWVELVQRAAGAGFDLRAASGFRSFAKQLLIWNGKARGRYPVLDDHGNPLDLMTMSKLDRMWAILRWSALPGTSRHHWGTDMDIWDAAAVPPAYALQLTPAEWAPGGPFNPLDRWLMEQTAAGSSEFFRPYAEDRGGVAPEAWHLSYRPLALQFARALSPGLVRTLIGVSDIALKDVILSHLDEIFARFVRTPD